ncbi:hypothetical protein HU200_017432 [Digitaria exilis]|uniref:Nucleoprotein TPR/MLP1 domain-containing protein n=1 Tax=Digitaria exilis TaxID=1010633 RepID=A0A835KJR1_9POAL|nr:hypothetical protein HU200_017432 [Digitaria exilis]
MPLFISDEELRHLGGDTAAVAERADAAIRELRRQVDTLRAEADAAAIAAEQTCALLEQRYATLSAEFDRSQAEAAELTAAAERRAAELAASQAEIHQLRIQAIAKDGEVERLKVEISELHKSKCQSLELIEQRDAEIKEKDGIIQSYYDKIVNLADSSASKEARIQEVEAKFTHCQAMCNRITQEKELLEKHNLWLDEELKAKVKNVAELRKTNMDEEAKMSARIAELEREISESSSSLRRSKERISELEQRVSYMEKELCSTKDAAAANEQRLSAELSTVMKLAELHKESSEEWSKKAGELEGVIKALETHLTQVEDEYKEKLEKETLSRRDLEKEAANLKQKLEKCELDLENTRKSSELSLIPLTSVAAGSTDLVDTTMQELNVSDQLNQNDLMLIPKVPSGVSGTALAASLLRDGWSLAKMYEKYQEATDALLHERRGRRHAETILERVLHEIEEKAELILDERAEHERMAEAYALMDQKLQQALLEHDNFENTIRNLKSELKRRERDYSVAQKEIDDLEKQVAVLLKECQDIQLRCGSSLPNVGDGAFSANIGSALSNVENNIKDNQMAFKDINGLVQQNVQLRNQVHMLSADLDKKDMELREGFQIELKKITDDAASRVEKVMKKSEEQAIMIESLHRSVAMYRKLCEEQQKTRSNVESVPFCSPDSGRTDLMVLFEGSEEVSKKAYEQVSERARSLDEELKNLRAELVSLRSERDKAVLEADFARDRLNGFTAELEHQRKETNSISLRNAELMHLIVDYERRLREDSDSKQALEENSRKLSMEVSILKHEKEILEKSEKRASDEVHDLTQRVHRLQATIDTIHTTEEVQENARSMERRNHEEHIKRLERDWAELKKELQEQRDHVRVLALDKKNAFDSCMKQVEDMRKELQSSWKAASDAESRAAILEAKCSDLEAKLKSRKVIFRDGGRDITATSEENDELFQLKEELEKYKEEAQANKNYMVQYKEIAYSNEVALKQLESAHQDYKAEAEVGRKALEDEIAKLRDKLSDMEKSYVMKCEEAASVIESKEKQITSLMNEISVLRTEVSQRLPQIESLEMELASSKNALDEQYKRWRTAQDNYERQVILQSETIQELTNTSKQLSSLQNEITILRQTADAQKAENDALRTIGEQEKIGLLKEKDDAVRKYNELNDQNRILHNQLEALHIRLAEKERSIAGLSSQRTDSHAEDDLHSVINYLRRSKEIAETEISLLKQEKSRLQIELESALNSTKEAQDLLRSQADSARTLMLKDEEFKSLQLQVREINLLRESNIQLREENKHNFEECQKFRDEAQKAKMESERLQSLLLEKEVDAEIHKKELEMQKAEIANLNQRISELVENSKGIDLKTYEGMKNELQNIKSTLRENSMELESAKKLLLEKEVVIKNLEEKLAVCQSELDSREKKLNDVEASLKSEMDRLKKVNFSIRRKLDNLIKEKEEVIKENQSLVKQIEDIKSSQKTTSETTLEQAIKEKDFRIQTLERTLEKERDDNKKEKASRKRNEKLQLNILQRVQQEKKQVEESIEKHRQAVKDVIENYPGLSSEVPTASALEEQILSYFRTAKDMEESSSPFRDAAVTQTPAVETAPVDAPASAAGRAVDTPPRPTKAKVMEDRAVATLPKPSTEARRPGGRRPLVRPTLERTEEPHADTDASAVDVTMVGQDKGGTSLERETYGSLPVLQSSSRKRLQTTDSASLGEANDSHPPSKKPKEEESSQGTSELKSGQPSVGDVAAQVGVLPSTDDQDGQQSMEEMDTDQASTPMEESEAIKDDDVGDKDDFGAHVDASLDTKGHDADVNIDIDAIPIEDVLPKSDAITESFDEDQKIEDSKEDAQLTTATDVDDEMEEGELPEESEQPLESALGETNTEPVSSDIGEQAGNAFRTSVAGGLAEKSDVDILEIEGDTVTEHAAVEPDQIPATQSGAADASPSRTAEASPAREPSPNPVQTGASSRPQNTTTTKEAREPSPNPAPAGGSSEQRNTSTVVEAAETRSRTINLSERARQNRQARFQRAQQPATARGRGQQSPAQRKDAAGRGPRGRGGRGQS